MKRALKAFILTCLGAAVGAGLGLVATFGIVKAAVALSPNDPSAASAGDICILLVPGGLIWGACVGSRRARSGQTV